MRFLGVVPDDEISMDSSCNNVSYVIILVADSGGHWSQLVHSVVNLTLPEEVAIPQYAAVWVNEILLA